MTIQSSKDGIFNEINITPLTDIFLVLLIIMMVVAPMFQAVDKDIDIPEINSGLAVEKDRVEISVTKTSEFFVDGQMVEPNQLASRLIKIAEEKSALPVKQPTNQIGQMPTDDELKGEMPKSDFKKEAVLKADKDTKSSEILKVMKAAQEAGYEKLIVAGKPLSNQAQDELKEKNGLLEEGLEE